MTDPFGKVSQYEKTGIFYMKKSPSIIIPQRITEDAKKIKEMLAQEGTIGVIYLRKRRSGMTMLQNLVSNTEDIKAEEQKQIDNATK